MSLIALRIVIILAISCLFVLLVAKLVSLFQNFNHGGGNSRSDDSVPTIPPEPGANYEPNSWKKRWSENIILYSSLIQR